MAKRADILAHGFSLVELFVVIGIIAVLISIIMPALQQARAQAVQIKCANNERQIGLALMVYVNENDGWMPPQVQEVDNFGDPLLAQPQPGFSVLSGPSGGTPTAANAQVFVCPAIADRINPNHPPTALSDTSYQPNGVVCGRRITAITQPSSVVFLQEYYAHANTCWQSPYANGSSPMTYVFHASATDTYTRWHEYGLITAGVESFSNNHNNGGNLCFVDGHVEYRKYLDLQSGDYGLVPNVKWSTTNGDDPPIAPGNYQSAF